MPFKPGFLGKNKLSGNLARWDATFREYHAADFRPGELSSLNYLMAMTDLFAQYCDAKWISQGLPFFPDFRARRLRYDDIAAKADRDILDLPMYRLLDFMAERISLDEFARKARDFRQFIIDKQDELFV